MLRLRSGKGFLYEVLKHSEGNVSNEYIMMHNNGIRANWSGSSPPCFPSGPGSSGSSPPSHRCGTYSRKSRVRLDSSWTPSLRLSIRGRNPCTAGWWASLDSRRNRRAVRCWETPQGSNWPLPFPCRPGWPWGGDWTLLLQLKTQLQGPIFRFSMKGRLQWKIPE